MRWRATVHDGLRMVERGRGWEKERREVKVVAERREGGGRKGGRPVQAEGQRSAWERRKEERSRRRGRRREVGAEEL